MHAHKHNTLIPSPYPVVNEYEKEFVCLGNKWLAEATDNFLEGLAKITSTVVKDK